MNGLSPNQVHTQLLPEPETMEPEMLDFALMRKGRVKINNWGFNLLGEKFELVTSNDLEGAARINRILEQYVDVLYDNLLQKAKVFYQGQYWCEAQRLNLASMLEPTPVLSEKLQQQARQRKLVRQELKEIQANPVRIALPMNEASFALEEPNKHELTDNQSVALPEPETDNLLFLSEQDRYKHLLEQKANLSELNREDKDFMESYEATDEYLAAKEMYQAQFEYYQALRANN